MFDVTPKTVIRKATLRNEAVDMGIPLEGTAKGVKDTNKTGHKIFRLINLTEHTKNNTADSLKEAVKERTVL
jgi:hypothetical protein